MMTHRLILLVLFCCTLVSCKRQALPSNLSLATSIDRAVASTATIPGSAEARVDTLAARLPASTQVAWMTGDLAAARSTFLAMEPMLSLMTGSNSLRGELRDAQFDALDASMWSEMGIPENSAMTFAYAEGHLFWLTFVEDSARFNTSFAERLASSFGTTNKPVREEFEGYSVRTLSMPGGEHVSWLHDGKLAIVALGTEDVSHPAQIEAIEALTRTERDKSCASTRAFAQWREAIDPNDPMFAYAHVEKLSENKEFIAIISEDPDSLGGFEMIEANAKMLGIRVQRPDPKSFVLSAIFGGNPEANAEAKRMGDLTSPFPFGGLVNEDAMLGMRLSLNVEHTLDALMANMPPDDKRALQGQLDAISTSWGMNRDIATMFTGHAAFFLYSLDMSKLMAVASSPERLHEALALGVGVELTDDAVANAIATHFSTRPDVRTRQVAGMLAIDLPDKGGSLYTRPRSIATSDMRPPQLYYRSDVLEERRMLAYIAKDVTQAKVRDSQLGRPFAGSKSHGGLYMDAKKWMPILNLVAAHTPTAQTFGNLDEIAITAEQTPAGPSLSLRFTTLDAP